MNSEDFKYIGKLIRDEVPGFPAELPGPEQAEGCVCDCGTDLLDLLLVACVTKYGGCDKEAAFKFVSEAEAILVKYKADLGNTRTWPTLPEKLDALKAQVGEETYNKLLVNPDIERIAGKAARSVLRQRAETALAEIVALFNGAISMGDMALIMREIVQAVDAVALISDE
jgi:hypothetical protein